MDPQSQPSQKYYVLVPLPQAQHLQIVLADGVTPDLIDELRQTLLDVLASMPGSNVILDLERCEYAGSLLLGMMVNLRHALRAGGGTMVICNLPRWLSGAMRASSMDRLFVTAASLKQAQKLL